jgi:SAM-dependent methyltransferase
MTKRDFFSHLSASWDDRHREPGELERLRHFSRHFRLQPGERVLDAGCGCGRLVPLICEAIGAAGSLVELDFAPGMLAAGRNKPHAQNVSFVLGDVHCLRLPDSEFDKVIALALLPHIDDKALALKEFRRVLKPGGLLVIAHQMGREALDRLHGEGGDVIQRDLLPGRAALAGLLADAGFSAIEILDEPDQYIAWAQA